ELQDLELKRTELAKKAEKSQILLNKLDEEVSQSQNDLAQKKNQLAKTTKEKEALQERLLSLTQEISNLNTDLQVAEQSDQYNNATKHEYENQLNELKKNLAVLSEKEVGLQKEVEQAISQETALTEKRDSYAKSLHSDPETLSKELENLRNDYIQSLQDQTSNNNDLVYAEN
ncbi:MAG: chromosome segregation protein SMC, partial [Lactobacillus iners]|nr:chromosome segregation protein SMC [Lactobacillus iners]